MASREGLPVLTIDLDGVICAPPLGKNLGIHRGFLDPQASPRGAWVPPRWLSWPLDHVRFDVRRPLPEAKAALTSLREARRLVVLTGRRSSPRYWLRWYGLAELVDEVVWNRTPLRSPHFKLETAAKLGATEHIDDDGRTVQLLAQRSPATPYLRDWPRNRDLPFDRRVVRVADLGELTRRVHGEPSSPPETG